MKRFVLIIVFVLGFSISASAEPWNLNYSTHAPYSYLVEEVSFGPNGNYFAFGTDNATVGIREPEPSWNSLNNLTVDGQGMRSSISWSPDGNYISTVDIEEDDRALIQEVGGSWDFVKNITDDISINPVSFGPKGNYFAHQIDYTNVQIRQVGGGWDNVTRLEKSPGEPINDISWGPSGNYIAYGYDDLDGSDVIIHEVGSGWTNVRNLTKSSDRVEQISWTNATSQDYIAYSTGGGNVYIHETEGDWTNVKNLTGFSSAPSGLSWSSGGDYLAVGEDGFIHVYNTSTWLKESKLEPSNSVQSLSWSLNDNYLAAGTFDSTIEPRNLFIYSVNSYYPFVRENLGLSEVSTSNALISSNFSLGSGELKQPSSQIYMRYKTYNSSTKREFNNDPGDLGDGIIAENWLENPSSGSKGYTFEYGWLVDNLPILPGGSRSYILNNSNSGSNLYYKLSSSTSTRTSAPFEGDFYTNYTGRYYSEGLNRIELYYSESGRSFDVLVFDQEKKGDLIANFTLDDSGLENTNKVYFINYGNEYGNDSLRLIEAEGSLGPIKDSLTKSISTDGVESLGVSALSPNQSYRFSPVMDWGSQDIGPLDQFTTKPFPDILLDAPGEGTVDQRVDSNLSVSLEGNVTVNATFYKNISGGSDELIGEVNSVDATPGGTAAELVTSSGEFEPNSTINWYVNVTDGYNVRSNGTWSFETEERPEVVSGSLQPSDGANDVEAGPELALNVTDDVNSMFTGVEFYNANSHSFIGSDTGVANNSKANITWSDADQGDTTYEWYAILETDSGIRLNTSNSTDYPDSWNFTTEQVLNAKADIFTHNVNRDPNGSYIGSSELKTHLYNDQGLAMDVNISVKDGGTWKVVEDLQNIDNDSVISTDISDEAFIDGDKSYDWKVEVIDDSVLAQNASTFSTHVVDLSVGSNEQFSSINIYYNSTGDPSDLDDYDLVKNVEASTDTSIKTANRGLDSSLGTNQACFMVAASLYGIEGSPSGPKCVGGDIP